MAVQMSEPRQTVYIEGDELVISELRERDPDVVGFARLEDVAEDAIRRCLRVGAVALRAVPGSLDTAFVDRRFTDFERRLDATTLQVVQRIEGTTARLFDPEQGEVRKFLQGWHEELEANLGETFDPKSKESVLSKFESLFARIASEQTKLIRNVVDPRSEDSPLARLRHEVAEEMSQMRLAVSALQAQVASGQGEAKVFDLTAVKGKRFEDLVFDVTSSFLGLHGDTVELVGATTGGRGRLSGDVLVTLNPDETPKHEARLVLEAKDTKLSLREAHAELDRAMKNRDAAAGVIVFSDQNKAPIKSPFKAFGNKAIAVLDKREPDEHAVQLAIMWARLAILRQHAILGGAADVPSALALVDKLTLILKKRSGFKAFCTRTKKEMDAAASQVEEICDEFAEGLIDLERLLGR